MCGFRRILGGVGFVPESRRCVAGVGFSVGVRCWGAARAVPERFDVELGVVLAGPPLDDGEGAVVGQQPHFGPGAGNHLKEELLCKAVCESRFGSESHNI